MQTRFKTVQFFERGLLISGLLLLTIFVLAHAHRFIMVRAEMARFEAKKLDAAARDASIRTVENNNPVIDRHQDGKPEYSLWSAQRIKSHQSVLKESIEPLAILRIPKLRLEVPVLDGIGEFTLNRGVGRIAGTSFPGKDGNIGIAGHRDGFFRGLKEISTGDVIELVTTSGTDVYLVDRVRVTSPSDLSVLKPRDKPSLTLVTCYPFYFVGPAPRRYIVEASLKQ